MRTLIHLSDLHFGRVDAAMLGPLREFVGASTPSLVAISGDLTQRALEAEFTEARRFLDSLPCPYLVVPGNHDVPLYNPFARFLWPLARYKKHITRDLAPFFSDEEIAVAGINTARSLTTQYGRVNRSQIMALLDKFRHLGDSVTRIVVTHHPFDVPPGYGNFRQVVGRSGAAMEALARIGVDLFLAGHLHLAHAGFTTTRYKISGYSALIVHAGTAISTRGRGEANSFNVLRISERKIDVERICWSPDVRKFECSSLSTFLRGPDGWHGRPQPGVGEGGGVALVHPPPVSGDPGAPRA